MMNMKSRHNNREIATAARRAIELTSLWDDVEIIDGVITGHLVVRPYKG